MIYRNIVVFLIFVAMTTGAVIAANDINYADIFVDDAPLETVAIDDDNGGNVYSLSYNSNGVESNDGQLQVWIE